MHKYNVEVTMHQEWQTTISVEARNKKEAVLLATGDMASDLEVDEYVYTDCYYKATDVERVQ